jgi:RNA polymerase-binding protein DksA
MASNKQTAVKVPAAAIIVKKAVPVAKKTVPAPVAKKAVPVVKKPAPVAKKPAPVAKKAVPVVKKAAPVAKKAVPVVQKPAPVAKKAAPVVKKAVPVVQKPAPVAKKAAPVAKKAAPVAKKAVPVVQKLAPAPKKPAMVREDETPWTAAELREIRAALDEDARNLVEEIASTEKGLVDLISDSGDGAGDDQADAGSKTFEREHGMSLVNNARQMLRQVEQALGRINDGSYGTCEGCGRPIGKYRLQAFPRATLCMPCKQAEER